MIRLIAPADDGLIQGDNDLRTPLRKITCPTCVEATLQSRTRRRLDAFRKREGARKMAAHSRLIAEAYARLAETEENLEIGTAAEAT